MKTGIRNFTAGLLALIAVPAAAQPTTDDTTAASPVTASASPVVDETGALTKTDVDAWLDGYMSFALKSSDIAGAVVVVVKDGEILTKRGFGVADSDTGVPVDPDKTLFRPGSVSKLFTWTAVMQLVEQGKLDLDKDVNAYLDFEIPPRNGKPITLRNIMTHTPGFEESVRGLMRQDITPGSLGDTLKRWTPKRIFDPGATPAYSNYATALAGYIVERVSGTPFNDYIEQNIFARIGMEQASFRQPLPDHLQPDMSQGYMTGSGAPMPYELIELAPAGSLAASGADMGRFMIAHLDDGGPLLSPATAKMMHETYLDMIPPLNRMALGFYEQNLNGHRIIAHGGNSRFFHSYLWLFLDDNVGVFISMNSTGRASAHSTVSSELLQQFADRYFPGETEDGRVDAETAAEHARMMAGNYISSRRSQSNFVYTGAVLGQMKVEADPQGELVIEALKGPGGAVREWVEIAPFIWRDKNSDMRLAAKVEDGKVQRFAYDASSAIMVFEPAPWTINNSWLKPASNFAMLVLLITVAAWPIAGIARRVYKAPTPLAPADRAAYHAACAASLLTLCAVYLWMQVFSAFETNAFMQMERTDRLVLTAQLFGFVAFFGLFAASSWNLWRVFAGGRSWVARLWAIALMLASIIVLWEAFVCRLLKISPNF